MLFRGLDLDPTCERWGYKEIWNGGQKNGPVLWSIYDQVFPNAFWVHIIRNPFDFGVSHLRRQHSEDEIDAAKMLAEFEFWGRVSGQSQKRRSTGRYHELRYEDLITEPRAEMECLLSKLGLGWREECLTALNVPYCPSDPDADSVANRLKGEYTHTEAAALAAEYGYVRSLEEHGVILRAAEPDSIWPSLID